MFDKEECFYLGNISRLHSFKGEVSIILDVDDPQEFSNLESIFVEIDNKLIPFFLESIKIQKNNFAIVKFEDIDSEKKAEKLLKAKLYLPLDLLPELNDQEFYYFEIEGFKAIDKIHGEIGIVQKILDLKSNPLIEILHPSGIEILVPKQDQFIENVDFDNETIYLNPPEGLIDMYLNPSVED